LSSSETHHLSPKRFIDEKTQAALSQIGREEKAAAADEVSPIIRHRVSIAQRKMMDFAEPVIGPATSGRTRWLNPSYELHSKKTELPRRSEMTRWARKRHFAPRKSGQPF
jgi:hypothetical protein